jgi:NADPH-dependent 2,4-dienoyl-CoA reductase/sulfur reductase-like enzyme
MNYKYAIVGGGNAAASAVEGIRAHDREGSILLLSRENHLPYKRPPLSKDLWFGKTTLNQISIHDDAWYRENNVTPALRREVVELSAEDRALWDDHGERYGYEKLLLATGARPRMLGATNAHLEPIHYYRSLEDYLGLRERLRSLQHVLVVGGGFISIEMAAALRHAGMEVTFVYPHEYPLQRVLPRDLGLHVADSYRQHGIETLSSDAVVAFEMRQDLVEAQTRLGNTITTQFVVAGVGADPSIELADAAGLQIGNGVEVDEYARTSDANIWAAGDVAEFPYLALGERTRIEHWDHAENHGRTAGENMAGAKKPYDYMPFFWSDFFDMGWEAVGDVDASLDVDVVWLEPYQSGVVFYLRDDAIRGALLWNFWDHVDWARRLIREAKPMSHEERVALVGEGAKAT